MKCPECRHDHKESNVKICGKCGFRFPSDLEEEWAISDKEIADAVDKYCAGGELYFTRGQLYSMVYKAIKGKHGLGAMGCLWICVLLLLVLAVPFLLFSGDFKTALFLVAIILVILVREGHKTAKQPGLPANIPEKRIAAYKKENKPEKLVDGPVFAHLTEDKLDREFLDHAPDRVLIVESEEIADMLLLNRFHFDTRTLVVGSGKYPGAAFSAYRNLVSTRPDIPVMILHDCSGKGLRMKGELLQDKSWALEGKNVVDLGLLPEDVGRNSSVPWLPADLHGEEEILEKGTPKEKLARGYGAPVSGIYPAAFISALTLAVNAGVPLFSKAFRKKKKETSRSAFVGGGFG